MTEARRLRVHGTVQGVGFRTFVARLARAHQLSGWVLNGPHGVDIHIEGSRPAIDAFGRALEAQAPPAALIEAVHSVQVVPDGFDAFHIRESERRDAPTVRISPDLPLCGDCLAEMFDPNARRFHYPYINCTNCGPRFSIIRALPYDRARTTMAAWQMCDACAAEYSNVLDRRFHAEPVACPRCGPHYRLLERGRETRGLHSAIARAAQLLRGGALVAIKGIGGYHLSCDATNEPAVRELRERKYRKAKPFAVMARDLGLARRLLDLDDAAEVVLTSPARPILLAPAPVSLPEVAPDHRELGVMLPYTPIHHLLFAAGVPDVLVMTSANRSSEPIALNWQDVLVAHDQHPHYASTTHALELPAARHVAVQHHRAHVASVLAERAALDTRAVGIAFDGTGYGDDGTTWGGEFFVGSVAEGLSRVASLRPFALPGGDAAARCPVQAAAGFLADVDSLPDLTAAPFCFPTRYRQAGELTRSGLRTFTTTSAGRLFDSAAALLGFTDEIQYEGQAAVWLEQLAWRAPARDPLPFHVGEAHIDFRPTLREMIERRIAGEDETVLARAFHEAIAAGIAVTAHRLCGAYSIETVVLSGGTFQNALLVDAVRTRLAASLGVWTNARVPPNDGGISLGQAALAQAALATCST
jgi:hydrogenase maturation factor HypF (carbamoyltransferase family)